MNKFLLLALSLPGLGFLTAAVIDEGLPGLSTLIIPGLIILLLIFINGLFVGAELAIIGVRPTQVEEMVEVGKRGAKNVMETLISREKQDHYIATAQLGITLASLGLGMYGEPQIAHFIEPYLTQVLVFIQTLGLPLEPNAAQFAVLIHSVAYIIALSLLTYLHVVLGEMIPKQLALADAKRAVILLVAPMQFMQMVFALPVRFLNAIGNIILQLLQVPLAEGHERVRSPDELELIVSESAKGGFLEEEEEEWIINIFNFGERQVNQVMTPRRKIEAIGHDTSPTEILEMVVKSRYSRFPVYQDDLDHIIGILHFKELVRHQISGERFDLDKLTQHVPIVPEDFPIDSLLNMFKRDRIHIAVVRDEFGGTAGIVTLEDLIEEIVGEVRDEFDKELEPIEEIRPGLLEAEGSYLVHDLIDDLEDHVDLGGQKDLPDVETIGGLIVAKLGQPPHEGDQVTYNDQVTFTVLTIDGLAVARAQIEYPLEETAGSDPSDSDEDSTET